MRSTEERLAAVRQRAREIGKKRSKRRSRVILASALAASLLTIVGLSFFIPSVTASTSTAEYFQPGTAASVFDASSSLGYILIGVLAFGLGVALTILCYRFQVRNKKEQGGNHGRAA